MKVIALLIAAASALTLRGIEKEELMQEQPSHWRKNWPEGDTDRGENDEDTINLAGPGRKGPPKPKEAPEKYPWTLDEDVVSTTASIQVAEDNIKGKLSDKAVRDRGMSFVEDFRDPAADLLKTRRLADGSLVSATAANNVSV